MYWSVDESVTRGSKEPSPVFPLEHWLSMCYFSVHGNFIEHSYQEQQESTTHTHTKSYTFSFWPEERMMPRQSGPGSAAHLDLADEVSSCSPFQEGGSASPHRCSALTCSWEQGMWVAVLWPHLCWRSTLVHTKAQPNPPLCGGPDLSRFTRDLTQWLLQRVSGKLPGRLKTDFVQLLLSQKLVFNGANCPFLTQRALSLSHRALQLNDTLLR